MSAVPGVMMVTDRRRASGRGLVEQVRAAAGAGLDFVQLREKDLPGGALIELAREIVAAVAGTPARVLVNGRPDVALLAGAHGVQLPADGLPVAEVRRAFGTLLVGASCHDVGEARAAAAAGAALVVFGPVFATPGKEARAQGLDALSRVVLAVQVPVYAIGGIEPDSAARVVSTGAAGLAAIRPFLDRDAGDAVRAFKSGAAAARP
jgi:thiamine-phosphate pyrophosphorylase